ncbi:hypothetical protein TD95_002074 [Thielaviopsis punctulata]|uniref:Uncharacterized protein n=1 Tax=Thielaviopsis punctulata TaxID=72032 RepID=A0A0F4ZK59_9PEZI|nr:hypothetical protein TD95_002074 [Thielaviopsis punctulata]
MPLIIRSPFLGSFGPSSPTPPSATGNSNSRSLRRAGLHATPLSAIPRLLFATRRGYLALLTVFVVVFWTVSWMNNTTGVVAFEAPLPVAQSGPAASVSQSAALGSHRPADATAAVTYENAAGKTAQVWTEPVVPVDAEWSRFAIVQYATNMDYLCNSLMIFEQLRKVNTRADLVLMYPDHYAPVDIANPFSKAEKLIAQARDEYGVKLHPIQVASRKVEDSTWASSYTKLLAWNLTSYDRVLSLDSDAVVLQNLDALFFNPPATLAAPRAYWLLPQQDILSSQLLLVTPSAAEFARITSAIESSSAGEYDMEIINKLYRSSALILPHRPYNMLTAEFRRHSDKEHEGYWGAGAGAWDALVAYNEAKFLHFSDWPVGKPWTNPGKKVIFQNQPACVKMADGAMNCAGRDIWVTLYRDFLVTRSRVCAIPLAKW